MITISKFGHLDYGRFGNQLFQYSLAKILSVHNNCFFYLNPSNHFLNFFKTSDLSYKPLDKNCNISTYIEKDPFGFDPNLFMTCNVDLLGFFQNLSYFNNSLDILKTEFIPNPKKITQTIDYLKQHTKTYTIEFDRCVCIHMRRTDYTIFQHKYGFLSVSYYLHIIEKYIQNYDFIFIISDDPNRVKKELKGSLLSSNVYVLDSLDTYRDFYTMYLSRINLIANSTFSWWAAMLSSISNEKDVYAPFPWINQSDKCNSSLNSQDINLYPESWKKINSNTIRWNKLFI